MGPGVGVDVGGGIFAGSLALLGCEGGSSLRSDMRLDVLRSCCGRDGGADAVVGGLCCRGGYGSPMWLDICLCAALIGRCDGGVEV